MTAGATIRRSTNKARPAVKRTSRGKKPPSMLTRAIGTIPISAAVWQRMATWAILMTAGGAMIAIAVMLGIPGYVGQQMAEGVGRAGFAVKRVEVTGIDRMERLTVYAVALDQTQANLKALQLQIATDVANAALTVQSSLEAVQQSATARELSLQRLAAAQSKFEVGMAINYEVVQAQRDFLDAQNNELRALLNYRKALVNFETVQTVGTRGVGAAVGGGGL